MYFTKIQTSQLYVILQKAWFPLNLWNSLTLRVLLKTEKSTYSSENYGKRSVSPWHHLLHFLRTNSKPVRVLTFLYPKYIFYCHPSSNFAALLIWSNIKMQKQNALQSRFIIKNVCQKAPSWCFDTYNMHSASRKYRICKKNKGGLLQNRVLVSKAERESIYNGDALIGVLGCRNNKP